MRLLRNEVFSASDHPLLGDKRFRVLDVDAATKRLILFQLDLLPRSRKPFVVDLDDLREWEDNGSIRWVDFETPRIMTLNDSEIPKPKRKKRDKRFKSIAPLIDRSNFLWQFAANRRCALVAEEAESQSVLAIEIYRILHRFWEYGQTQNALLDNTASCGAPGKDRTPGARPLGAPLRQGIFIQRSKRKVNIDDESPRFLRRVNSLGQAAIA